jgi:hypothetical protein
MIEYTTEPWPSTYEQLGEVKPQTLVSKFRREVRAFRTAIPAHTIEPPQIHLTAPDGQPFEELITDFNMPFHVALFDPIGEKVNLRKYLPGENIIIPEYVAHWLVNHNERRLEFTCEYAPHPWNGDRDEPEFPNLATLLKFIDEKDLRQKLMNTRF